MPLFKGVLSKLDNFPMEFAKPIHICFDLLGRSHVHVFDKKSTIFEMFSSTVFVVCAVVFDISLLTYLGKVFAGEIDFVELPYIVPVLTVAIHSSKLKDPNGHSGILKAAVVIPKKGEIRTLIVQLGAIWRTDNLTQVQINKKNGLLNMLHICQSAYYWLNILGSWQYILVPLFETLFRRFILKEQSELLFPFACSFPFDPTKTWARYIAVYAFQAYSMIHLVYIYLGAEFLLITLCAHLSTEFSLLQEDLRDVIPTSNERSSDDVTTHNTGESVVKVIVTKHQRLIALSKALDEIFNRMIFANLLFASVTICFFGFVTKMARGPTDVTNNFVGVLASLLPLFNLCYYGEVLNSASIGIADSAYESPWYKGDVAYQKIIFFIIKRSQRPCRLTSLKYATVTLATFTTVLSTTWSYFSLATTMYEDKKQ